MRRDTPRNLSASVASRLLTHARKAGEDYQHILLRYGLERFMHRLGQSAHADEFIVKGAMLFLVWTGEQHRPTKDLDLMAAKARTPQELRAIFEEVCEMPVEGDGLTFPTESLRVEEIRENNDYGGMRVTLHARLGNTRIPIQVDVGYADAVTPKAREMTFPALLDQPAPRLRAYPKETVVAEKFEAMVKLGISNSRMKDYYDLWVLAREFEFDGSTLARAIAATFRRRKTLLPDALPIGLSDEFATDAKKLALWRAFLRRSKLSLQAGDSSQVVQTIREFVFPAVQAAKQRQAFPRVWPKGGPWTQE